MIAEHNHVRTAYYHGATIALFMLGCMYLWFARANRYVIFLYDHDMGPLYPDTSPFSRVTTSRYLMTGPVAAGAVLVVYACSNWLADRLCRGYHPPAWTQVWLVAAVPLVVGLPVITMTQNQPTLPALLALAVTGVALVALAFALPPATLAASRPRALLWLAADGWGVALLLLTLIQVDKVRFWLSSGRTAFAVAMAGGALAGLGWLLLLRWLRVRRGQAAAGVGQMLYAGACVAYLLLPFLHYSLGTDGYFYITDSDNFFARTLFAQIFAWAATGGILWIVCLWTCDNNP